MPGAVSTPHLIKDAVLLHAAQLLQGGWFLREGIDDTAELIEMKAVDVPGDALLPDRRLGAPGDLPCKLPPAQPQPQVLGLHMKSAAQRYSTIWPTAIFLLKAA